MEHSDRYADRAGPRYARWLIRLLALAIGTLVLGYAIGSHGGAW